MGTKLSLNNKSEHIPCLLNSALSAFSVCAMDSGKRPIAPARDRATCARVFAPDWDKYGSSSLA